MPASYNSWLVLLSVVVALGVSFAALQLASRGRRHRRNLDEVSARLAHQSTHDAITGLPNRVLFLEHLQRQIDAAAPERRPFAVLALDLDRFKVINDTLGHAVGDQLLRLVSTRLTGALLAEDLVARTGGDEFLLLIGNVEARGGATDIASALVAELDREYEIGSMVVHTSASIGSTSFPADGLTADVLVARADEAMYFAKQNGRNTYYLFNVGMSVFSQARLDLENDLRRALPLQQFELHYQPKMEVKSGRIASVEALLRWRHPQRGFVSPATFIPLAEESGLMYAIDEWVLREGCRQAREWQLAGLPFIRVAVNVSPVNFRQSKFPIAVRQALNDFELDPRYLEVELTETSVMKDAESSVGFLEDLSRMGVLVSIDDFGTGYSSMSYLRKLPLDKLKIDRSFISDLAINSDAAAIVKAIISLAHSLRLKVVAEGVETEAQLQQLKALDCDQFQGWLRSPAVLPSAIVAMIRVQEEHADASERLGFQRTQSKLGALGRAAGQ